MDVTAPLRELTKDNVHFQWTGECQQSFRELKSRLTEDTGLVNYDLDRETRLYMDQGPVGIASTIAQKYNKGGEEIWKAVYHNGRRLERAEERYHKIEGESLAIYSRIKMNSRYLHGTTFTVMTDHAALLPLYNKTDRPAPARVERHRSRLRGYDFNVDFCPGEKMPCDYSSRHLPPSKRNYTMDEKKELGIEQEEEDAEVWINRISETFLQAITTRQLQEETERDPELSGILRDLQTGMKSKNTSKGPYYEELQEWNRIVRRGTQVVMHKALQPRAIALTRGPPIRRKDSRKTQRDHMVQADAQGGQRICGHLQPRMRSCEPTQSHTSYAGNPNTRGALGNMLRRFQGTHRDTRMVRTHHNGCVQSPQLNNPGDHTTMVGGSNLT